MTVIEFEQVATQLSEERVTHFRAWFDEYR